MSSHLTPADAGAAEGMAEAALAAPEAAVAEASVAEPPGGALMWIITLVETITFGLGLVSFTLSRRDEPSVFSAGHASLNQPLALGNTLVLLTGGWLMASGLGAARRGDGKAAGRWIISAMLAGGAFIALKSVEYSGKLGHGLGLHHDTFFTYYWMLTGFHLLHVIVALVILAALLPGVMSGKYTGAEAASVESGGVFWHMCDLIWILLYATVYLAG